jgi:putative peptide zinc metalloprotease protein
VSDDYGRVLDVDGLRHLLHSRLLPLGLVTQDIEEPAVDAASGRAAPTGPLTPALTTTSLPTAQPLLSLSLRGSLVPARWVPGLAKVLAPFFWPPVVVLALVSLVALDIRLVRVGDLGSAVTDLLMTPTLMLGLYALLTAGALVHETGHAAACAYGGGRPGAIGFGVYLLFPAFYTDVTDSYRLSRGGRLRTDLGGLYFNVLCLIALSASYLATGSGILLLAVLVMHIEMAQQLVPAVRLDGYYVLSDLAGVPDLFSRVGPVLRSLRRGGVTDPRVAELRPAARRVVIAWVCFVVPTLIAGTLWLLWSLPFIVTTNLGAMEVQARQFASARALGDLPVMALSIISLLLLAVPLLGLGVLIHRLARAVWRLLHTGRSTRPAPSDVPSDQEDPMSTETRAEVTSPAVTPPIPPGATSEPQTGSRNESPTTSVDPPASVKAPGSGLTADDFRDDLMLPSVTPIPRKGWRRAVFSVSGHAVNLGPGSEERRQLELEERLRTPITGSRRIVVMSRKGGVGKTTMSLAIGSTFASLRGDRVVAVDANPDAGNLAHRVARPNDRTITDVLEDLEQIETYSQLRTYTSQARESRLEVLASDDDPRIGMALGRDEYHSLIGLLDRFYNLIVLDTGTGILDSANQGLLAEADQLVLVLRAGIDGGRAAALTLDWLDQHQDGDLVSRAVVVINAVRKGVGAPIGPIVEHFERRCRRVVLVPWDPALELVSETSMSALKPETTAALVEVAAAVADGFVADGPVR